MARKKAWKRLLGVSKQQGKLSRKLGVPLSASGRRRKLSRAGCAIWLAVVSTLLVASIAIAR